MCVARSACCSSGRSWSRPLSLSLWHPPPSRAALSLQVVIKKINVGSLPEEERRTAQREAALLASLKHPAVLRHIESFEDAGFLCIVTEFCERGDLAARVERQRGVPLAEHVVLDLFVQLCLALLYVHKRHVLHRDLKLANVFLSADNGVVSGAGWLAATTCKRY